MRKNSVIPNFKTTRILHCYYIPQTFNHSEHVRQNPKPAWTKFSISITSRWKQSSTLTLLAKYSILDYLIYILIISPIPMIPGKILNLEIHYSHSFPLKAKHAPNNYSRKIAFLNNPCTLWLFLQQPIIPDIPSKILNIRIRYSHSFPLKAKSEPNSISKRLNV